MERLGRRALSGLAAAAVLAAGCGATARPTATRPPVTPATGLGVSSEATTADVPTTAGDPAPAPALRFRPAPPAPTTTTPSSGARLRAAVRVLLDSLPSGRFAVSGLQQEGGSIFVVVARDVSTTQSVIDVDTYRNGSFDATTRGIGLAGNLDPVVPGSIQSGQITDSPVPDFLILLRSTGGGTGVVLTEAGGSWHTLGLEDRGGSAASDELINPRLVGSDVTQAIDMCAPSCAQGNYFVTTYGYDAATDELVQVGATTESPQP